MSKRNNSGGLTTLLGLVAVGLIVAGIVYSVQDSDKKKAEKKESEKPERINVQPRRSGVDAIAESLGLGDGTLKSASKTKASGLGEARTTSGGRSGPSGMRRC